jgi:hypothetical protein
MGKLKAKSNEAKRKVTVSMSKTKLDVEMTITKRLQRLEDGLAKSVEAAITEYMEDLKAKNVKAADNSPNTVTSSAPAALHPQSSNADRIGAAFVVDLTERLKVLEKFFHGFSDVQVHTVTAEAGANVEVPLPAEAPPAVPVVVVAKQRQQQEEEKGEKKEEEEKGEAKKEVDTPTPTLSPAPNPAATAAPPAPAPAAPTAPSPAASTTLTSSSSPPSSSSSSSSAAAATTATATARRPSISKVSPSNPATSVGLVWQLTSSQKVLKNELSDLKAELAKLSADVARRPRRSSMQRELANVKVNAETGELVDVAEVADSEAADMMDDDDYILNEVKKLAQRLSDEYMTKEDMNDMYRKSLSLKKHSSRPQTPAEQPKREMVVPLANSSKHDEEVDDKISKLSEDYNKDHEELMNFESRLSEIIDGIHREVDVLHENKMNKEDHKAFEENTRRQMEGAKYRQEEMRQQVDSKLTQVESDTEKLKKYIEDLEDNIKKLMSTKGISKDEFDQQLVSATSRIETNLQRALMAGVIEELTQKVATLTASLTDLPGMDQIESMIANLEKTLSAQFGDSRTIQIILENLKSDLRRKVTKSDVLNLVNASVEEIRDSLNAPDDTMMIGRVPVRCLSCNQSLTGMHGSKAKAVNHKALSMTPSTLAPDPAKSAYLVENGVMVRDAASFNSGGRMGALKPLGNHTAPGVPRVSVGIGQRRGGGGANSPGGTGTIVKGVTSRPGTAPGFA